MRIEITGRLVAVRRLAAVVVVGVVLGVLGGVAPALGAPAAGWLVLSEDAPSYIPPGGEGQIIVTVENVGDAAANGSGTPVTVADKLPAGLEVTGISGHAGFVGSFGEMECSTVEVSCVWSSALLPSYEAIEVTIGVKAAADAVSGVSEISVSGGDVPSVLARRPVTVSAAAVPFGVESDEFSAEEEGGVPDTRAGSHPFQLTTAFALNQTASVVKPPALVRNLAFALPAGLIGNVTSVPQCTAAQFQTVVGGLANACPADTAVGAASLAINVPFGSTSFGVQFKISAPVFNLVPSANEPARFGFSFNQIPVVLDTALRTGGDYGVTVSSNNTTQFAVVQAVRVSLWGVPADPRHDAARGWNCIGEGHFASGPCVALGASRLRPLLTLPTSCTGALQSSLAVTSWPTRANPAGLAPAATASEPIPGLEGCGRLPFEPELSVAPDTQTGGTPNGFGVGLHIPQLEAPEGLAEGNLKKAVVTLPRGVVVNPAGANGLAACSQAQIGLDNAGPASCPEASKVGTAEAISPAVRTPLVGSIYVAQQGSNPFGSLLALYMVLQGEGVLIKVAGNVQLDPVTGQVTTTFDNIPQQPVSDVKLHLFGGPHAALASPVACGTYMATSQLTPYNALVPAEPFSAFQVTSGPGGGGCAGEGFSPSFTAGTTINQAAGFSPLSVTFSRQDGEQSLGSVKLTTPPGLLGVLKSVQQCGEPQAAQGTCGAGSLIGSDDVGTGAGADPLFVKGRVYLTGPYKGAPFGLSIVDPAEAGPFNLGNVVIRAAITVDPHTAQITVTSDPLPTILQGIPLQIRTVNVTIDREGFMFNPTDCEPLTVGGTLSSTQGTSVGVSSRFQAANCANLPFKPAFTASTQARTSKKNGASLDVKVAYPAGSANIHSVAVTLPKQLPARLTTIQQACPEATFNQNPAGCPVGSQIGVGTALTPILANPVTGPAYLVSHGGASFPDLVVILQGEGVTLNLVGSINIKHNITSSTFASVPDAPISSFELTLPEGPHSGLAAVLPTKAKGNMCGQALTMPTTLTGQNGAVVKQNTKIAVTGCSKAKKKPKAKKRRKGGKKGK